MDDLSWLAAATAYADTKDLPTVQRTSPIDPLWAFLVVFTLVFISLLGFGLLLLLVY